MAKDEDLVDDAEIVVVEDEPVEVADSGEVDSTEEEEKPKKTVARKRGNDAQKQISALWLKRKEAEAEAERQASISQAERQKSSQYEKITASALEENINTKRELIKYQLMAAQQDQDAKKVVDLTAELSKIDAQAAQIDRYKLENQVSEKNTQQQQRPQGEAPTFDDIYESMSPAGKSWMSQNRDWYDADSESHDAEKSADITYYAKTLEGQYRTNGRAAEIGTRAYFKAINDYIEKNWSDDVGERDEEEEKPAPKKNNYAAPVGNRGGSTQPASNAKQYKITQAEKEMALAMNHNDSKGRQLSDNDKIKRFLAVRENTPSAGPISMKTLNKG